ncbi:MAG: hypothetical protein L6R40_004658 [Gallowayella cf. fulva]|nr:MAG: hypothetical protein L6R40_004658 [Xanthomendoza cf. fulva]
MKCAPERRKASIAVSVSTSSPTCSLDPVADLDETFQIVLTLRVENATQPCLAVTFCTNGTVFAPSAQEGGIDTLGLGTFGPLVSIDSPDKKIHLGNFKLHAARVSTPKSNDLKERKYLNFLTVPAKGEVQVKHDLPVSRMLKYDQQVSRDDLYPGESYSFRLNPDYLGTTWWCWGDLEGDLAGKKLSAWQEGLNPEKGEKPTPEQIQKEGWVLGGNPAELAFEETTKGVQFQFVA